MERPWLRLTLSTAAAGIMCPTMAWAQGCTPQTFSGALDQQQVTLCQNWDAEEQQKFWFLSQGSQIIPYNWFLHLEQPASEVAFNDKVHMDGFRYLPQRRTARNPDELPIGFTKGSGRGNDAYAEIADEWLGMTCAACHTGQIEFNGRKMLIDGAPTMADFEGFMQALVGAMQATLQDDLKFDRFARGVLGPASTGSDATAVLRRQLEDMTLIRERWNLRNRGRHPYGFARLDAIGAIFNEVTAGALDLAENAEPATAPVSYPFIWDTPQHDRVQWNGSVENKRAGALGRNVGEVLGVFGSLELNTSLLPHQKKGHKSSVDIGHLGQLEELLWKLQSPLWPETILPAIDNAKGPLTKGRQAFVEHCSECHADIDRDDPRRRITAVLTPLSELGTDDAMARNFASRVARTGPLKGRLKTYLPLSLELFSSQAKGVEILRYAVTGVIFNGLLRDPSGTLDAVNAGRDFGEELIRKASDPNIAEAIADDFRMAGTVDSGPVQLVYKARPLNGIWATAPYLHNGSVRTLRQLLLPSDTRQTTFRVGSREYDPKDVGFVDDGAYLFDTRLPGNSNRGHEGPEYGTAELQADPEVLEALLEYLKTL